MPGGSSARAITPLLPNDLAANHCLFRLSGAFTQFGADLGSWQPDLSLSHAALRALASGDRPPFASSNGCCGVLSRLLPLPRARAAARIRAIAPPFRGTEIRDLSRECPDDSRETSTDLGVEHGTYPRAIAPHSSGGCPLKYSGDYPLVFGRSPPA
jgi:hypothetical protein